MAVAHGLFILAQLARPADEATARIAWPSIAAGSLHNVSAAEPTGPSALAALGGPILMREGGNVLNTSFSMEGESFRRRAQGLAPSAMSTAFNTVRHNAEDDTSWSTFGVAKPSSFESLRASYSGSSTAVAHAAFSATHRALLATASLYENPDTFLLDVAFIAAALLAGFCFGSVWPHLVVLTSELFGTVNLQANYMFFDGGCGASGTILLANLMPRIFHSREGNCDSTCYIRAHAVIGGFCILGAAAAAVVAINSTTLYWKIGASREAVRLRRRLRREAEAREDPAGGALFSQPPSHVDQDLARLSPWEVRAELAISAGDGSTASLPTSVNGRVQEEPDGIPPSGAYAAPCCPMRGCSEGTTRPSV
eukprot:scaffold85381_cov30-Tisochrysis_lutea.AAC.2